MRSQAQGGLCPRWWCRRPPASPPAARCATPGAPRAASYTTTWDTADDGHPAAWKGRCAAASLGPRGRNIPDRFQRLPPDHGITCSMSRAGNVRDSPAMESFFSSLKTERTARMVYRTRDEARADAFDYIERFYNSGGVIRSWAISDGVRGTGHADFTRCPRNRQQANMNGEPLGIIRMIFSASSVRSHHTSFPFFFLGRFISQTSIFFIFSLSLLYCRRKISPSRPFSSISTCFTLRHFCVSASLRKIFAKAFHFVVHPRPNLHAIRDPAERTDPPRYVRLVENVFSRCGLWLVGSLPLAGVPRGQVLRANVLPLASRAFRQRSLHQRAPRAIRIGIDNSHLGRPQVTHVVDMVSPRCARERGPR